MLLEEFCLLKEEESQKISPMLYALKLHIKRSPFQAIKWSQCLIKDPSSSLADPSQLDWKQTKNKSEEKKKRSSKKKVLSCCKSFLWSRVFD